MHQQSSQSVVQDLPGGLKRYCIICAVLSADLWGSKARLLLRNHCRFLCPLLPRDTVFGFYGIIFLSGKLLPQNSFSVMVPVSRNSGWLMACGKPLTFKTPLPSSSVCNEFEYHTLASKLTSLVVNNTT